jgi:hypothetical protein
MSLLKAKTVLTQRQPTRIDLKNQSCALYLREIPTVELFPPTLSVVQIEKVWPAKIGWPGVLHLWQKSCFESQIAYVTINQTKRLR